MHSSESNQSITRPWSPLCYRWLTTAATPKQSPIQLHAQLHKHHTFVRRQTHYGPAFRSGWSLRIKHSLGDEGDHKAWCDWRNPNAIITRSSAYDMVIQMRRCDWLLRCLRWSVIRTLWRTKLREPQKIVKIDDLKQFLIPSATFRLLDPLYAPKNRSFFNGRVCFMGP